MNSKKEIRSAVRNDVAELFDFLEDPCEDDLARYDENVRNAIQLARNKDQYSEFYRKLQKLNDRIQVYKAIFLKKEPKFIR